MPRRTTFDAMVTPGPDYRCGCRAAEGGLGTGRSSGRCVASDPPDDEGAYGPQWLEVHAARGGAELRLTVKAHLKNHTRTTKTSCSSRPPSAAPTARPSQNSWAASASPPRRAAMRYQHAAADRDAEIARRLSQLAAIATPSQQLRARRTQSAPSAMGGSGPCPATPADRSLPQQVGGRR